MPCAICGVRKPRRQCPAVGGDICTVCCATGREETIDCPVSCGYLREAHRHETKPDYDVSKMPNRDIKVTEQFLAQHEVLLAFIAIAIYEGALKNPSATDQDVREAFEALISNARAGESGLILDTRPVNVYADDIVTLVEARIGEIRRREAEASGKSSITGTMLLGVLAFLQRLEYSHNNGRKRCRAFLDFLSTFYAPENPETDLIGEPGGEISRDPDEPLIIL